MFLVKKIKVATASRKIALPLARIDRGVFLKTIFVASSGQVKKTESLDTRVSKSETFWPETGSKILMLFLASFFVNDFFWCRQIFLSKSTSSFSWQQSFKKFETFLTFSVLSFCSWSSVTQRKNISSSALLSGSRLLESSATRSKQPKLGSRVRIWPVGEITEREWIFFRRKSYYVQDLKLRQIQICVKLELDQSQPGYCGFKNVKLYLSSPQWVWFLWHSNWYQFYLIQQKIGAI